MRCSAVEYEAHPPTITGRSNPAMNSFRLSGSVWVETCSAETTVPWITRTSSPASSTIGANRSTRWGVSDAQDTTPSALISSIRLPSSSGFTGSLYSSCIRRVALSSVSPAISS